MTTNEPFGDPGEVVKMFSAWAKQHRPLVLGIIIVVVLAMGALTAYYQVEPEELGVVMRFGRHVETAEPGPHFKIPFGVDRVIKVPGPDRQLKMEFGFRTTSPGVRTEYIRDRQSEAEAEMLTGDRNVAIVEWVVQYRIRSPEKYLFNFRDIESTLRLMSEAAMRAVVGDHSIDETLTGGREAIEHDAKELLIELNKRYDTGIAIQQLKLQDVNTPEPVRPALREVEEAKQERERLINEAWAEYNQVIPTARGKAEQSIETAEGYKTERINQAKGDAARFEALESEYRKAPAVTRARLYLEALGEILPKTKHKVILDAETKGLVPLLNMTKGGQP